MSKKIKITNDLQKKLNSTSKNTIKNKNKSNNQTKKGKIEKTPDKTNNHYQKIQKKVMKNTKVPKTKKNTKSKNCLDKKMLDNKQDIKLNPDNDKKIKKSKNVSSSKNKKIIFTLKASILKFGRITKNIFIKIIDFLKKISKKMYFNLLKLFKTIKSKIIKLFKREKKQIKKSLKEKKQVPEKVYNKNLTEEKIKYEITNLDYPVIKSLTGRILPLTLTKWDKKRRRNIYLKEAILFSMILTLIDVYCFYNLSFMNILNIFDNSVWNLIATIAITLMILLLLSYLIDYLITESMVRKYQKNKEIR